MTKSKYPILFTSFLLVLTFYVLGCETDESSGRFGGSDSDGDADGDGGGDSDTDSDTDTDTTPPGPIEPNCMGCDDVGSTVEHMACAIELCDPNVLLSQSYQSLTVSDQTLVDTTHAAVNRFGDQTNGLGPLHGDSYALMATGPALGTSHGESLDSMSSAPDPTKPNGASDTYDVMEWTLRLKAPEGAHGFQIHYVFLSEEYDEFVGSMFNDKFYIILENAQSTADGGRVSINFTECRDQGPNAYKDFVCNAELEALGVCNLGAPYCFIAINTALSECCWYNNCPQGTWTTSLAGTGFSCAANQGSDSVTAGSSTGWLKTEWPIEPGEEFDITFHIHDTGDANYDSEVIIDKFLFVGKATPGTAPAV